MDQEEVQQIHHDQNIKNQMVLEIDESKEDLDDRITFDKIKKVMQDRHLNFSKKIDQKVWNRRNKKLTQLIEEEEYFQEDAIKFRQPLLYHIYIGRYQRGEGQKSDFNGGFGDLLQDQMMNEEYQKILIKELLKNEDLSMDPEMLKIANIPLDELEDNEDELIRIMHYNFLMGLDSKFIDYTNIDENEELDDLKIQQQDEEEHFFDNEEQQIIQGKCSDTGIQDF